MLLKLSYIFKLKLWEIKYDPHCTHKENSYRTYTKENKKQYKHSTTKKNQLITKTVMQEMKDKKAIRHIENKQQNDRMKFFLISNYLKCKWIKSSNQKIENDRMN